MWLLEFEVESSKSTTRPVQFKVHGASTDIRKPEIGSSEDSSHIADAQTGRHSSTEAISGDSDLPWKIYAPPVRDDNL